MAVNENKVTESEYVQVFELTMDNTEDQDELNRRLRKPGEADRTESTSSSGQASLTPEASKATKKAS